MKRRIAVAGAGIGGLAFAALAARDGHRVTVFDRFEAPRPVGSGLVIQPVGQAVLGAMGAAARALELGQPIERMLGHEAEHGRVVLDVRYDPGGGSGRFGLAIHRASLFECVLSAARRAGAELVTGHRVTGREGQRLRFDGGRREGPFDLIVDACGAGSVLSPLRARALGYGAIWGTVPWPAETGLPLTQLSQRYRRASHMIGALPIGRLPGESEKRAAIFWSLPADSHAQWRTTPLERWKAEATALWPGFAPFLETVDEHDRMTMARYSHGTLWRPAGAGIAHIGDAAHRASPQLGQGANMALLDAYALAVALRQHDPGDALRTYVLCRRWHVALYQAFSAVFTPQYQSDSRILPWLRDRVLMPLSSVPPLPRVLSHLVSGALLPPHGSLRETGV